MTYQPAVYRQQGGDSLIVASSGTVTVESGGTINVDSGGILSLDSGAVYYEAVQTLAVANVATPVTANGFTFADGHDHRTEPTRWPHRPMAGQAKDIAITATSSGVTHRAVAVRRHVPA